MQTFSQPLDQPDLESAQPAAQPVAKPPAPRAANWLSSIQSLNIAAQKLDAAPTPSPSPAAPGATAHEPTGAETEAMPPVPNTIEETGLSEAMVEQLLLKIIYFRGELTGRQLAVITGLQWSIIEPILENLKRLHIISMRKSMGMGSLSGLFALSDQGRSITRDYLQTNSYAGRAPVPLEKYTDMVRRQRFGDNWLSREMLQQALAHLVLTPEVVTQLGPAINSGKSFLVYGQPGNGKTFLAEAMFNIQSAPIYVPYAIEAQGQIIQVYDPLYHSPMDPVREDEPVSIFNAVETAAYDNRWFKTKRPWIMTGGELTLPMLDLSYNEASKVYDAPFQLKANNGIYLIDDFGRQKVSPAEVLNRWIVPMERKIDYLSFNTGGKMCVPFECFLIFSTNLAPDQIGDEAFLRRIQYKMMMKNPTETEFAEIFCQIVEKKKFECEPEVLERFLEARYRMSGKKMRRCHPRDILSHAEDLIKFERLPWRLTNDLLDHAFEGCFLTVDHRDT